MLEFTNTSGMVLDYCPPFFGSVDRGGPNYHESGPNGTFQYDYATSVRVHGKDDQYYRFMRTPSSQKCYPTRAVDATFIYDVPQDVEAAQIDDVVFTTKGRGGMDIVPFKASS